VIMDHHRQNHKVMSVHATPSRTFNEFFGEAMRLSTKTAEAHVAAVCEPLKVRTITKMPAVQSAFAKRCQVIMHDSLREKFVFSCLDKPIDEKMISSFLGNCKASGNRRDFVSGDYKGATDGVKIAYTKQCFESFLDILGVPSDLRQIYRNILYECEIHYPAKYKIDPVKQTTGQLMGSVLSFPILCAINFVAWWRSEATLLYQHSNLESELQAAAFLLQEWNDSKDPLQNCPCLVNGDDILFSTVDEHYDIWKSEIDLFGFKLSLGKNYVHDKFIMINSRPYWIPTSEFIDFFNVGLLTGTSKVMSRVGAAMCLGPSDDDDFVSPQTLSLRDQWNTAARNCRSPKLAWATFYHTHKDELREATLDGLLNPFIPCLLGGLGFQSYGVDFYTTRTQRRLARKQFSDMKTGVSPSYFSFKSGKSNAPLGLCLEDEKIFMLENDESAVNIRPVLKRTVRKFNEAIADTSEKFSCYSKSLRELSNVNFRNLPSYEYVCEHFPQRYIARGILLRPLDEKILPKPPSWYSPLASGTSVESLVDSVSDDDGFWL